MDILRLSTLSLALAVAVFALGNVNTAYSAKPDCEIEDHPSCKDEVVDDTTSGGKKASLNLVFVSVGNIQGLRAYTLTKKGQMCQLVVKPSPMQLASRSRRNMKQKILVL